MQYIITPAIFNKYEKPITKLFMGLAGILFVVGVYSALFASPPDYQQGEVVRIMYIHVPAAWLSLGIYISITVSAISYLIWKNPLSAIFMKSAIPIGTIFCLICLITGAIWAKPIWGIYWAWDARLTSMLILFFIYIGLYLLYNAFEDEDKGARATAVMAVIGLVNIPIIRMSVRWWNTLHQPASVMRLDKPAIQEELLVPLIIMTFFFLSLFISLLLISVKTEILKKKNQRNILQSNK